MKWSSADWFVLLEILYHRCKFWILLIWFIWSENFFSIFSSFFPNFLLLLVSLGNFENGICIKFDWEYFAWPQGKKYEWVCFKINHLKHSIWKTKGCFFFYVLIAAFGMFVQPKKALLEKIAGHQGSEENSRLLGFFEIRKELDN